MLSPLSPGIDGIAGELLDDPLGFTSDNLGEVDRKIAAFFTGDIPPMAGTRAASGLAPGAAD